MSKPNYRVILNYDIERKLFLARVPELSHCTAEGPSRAEAMQLLEEEIDAQLANMLSQGTTPPRAVDEEEFSGEVSCKLSRTLHRDLAVAARSEGIELDHLLGELIASALEGRKQSGRGRHGNRTSAEGQPHDSIGNRSDGGRGRGFGGRGANPAMLDDRANFIEYVRNLDQGQAQQGGYNRGAGHNGGGHNNGGARGGQRRRGPGGGGHNPNHAGGRGQHGRPQQQGHGGHQNQNAAPRNPSENGQPSNGHAGHAAPAAHSGHEDGEI